MNRTITFEYNGKEYTLEFTRKTVQEMDREGFKVQDVDTYPATMIPKLFAGAFKAHHRHLKQPVIDEIFDSISNRYELIEKLAEMYMEPIQALMDEPDEDTGKNVDWVAS